MSEISKFLLSERLNKVPYIHNEAESLSSSPFDANRWQKSYEQMRSARSNEPISKRRESWLAETEEQSKKIKQEQHRNESECSIAVSNVTLNYFIHNSSLQHVTYFRRPYYLKR